MRHCQMEDQAEGSPGHFRQPSVIALAHATDPQFAHKVFQSMGLHGEPLPFSGTSESKGSSTDMTRTTSADSAPQAPSLVFGQNDTQPEIEFDSFPFRLPPPSDGDHVEQYPRQLSLLDTESAAEEYEREPTALESRVDHRGLSFRQSVSVRTPS